MTVKPPNETFGTSLSSRRVEFEHGWASVNPNEAAYSAAGNCWIAVLYSAHRIVEEAARGGDLVLDVGEFVLQLA
jgi:hypothetical protein